MAVSVIMSKVITKIKGIMDFFDFSSPGEMAKNLREMVRCPFCGSEYTEKNIRIVGRFEKNYVLQLMYRQCSNSIMANLAYRNGPDNFFEAGNKAMDVEFKEMIDFFQKGPLSNDDVMDFFRMIKDFDGDFNKAFDVKQKTKRIKKI